MTSKIPERIVIAVLIILLILVAQWGCHRKPIVKPVIKDSVRTEVRTVPGDAVFTTNTVTVHDTSYIPQPIPARVDTAEIMKDYFAIRSEIDSMHQDSSYNAVLHLKISQNHVIERLFSLQNIRPKEYITTTIDKPLPPLKRKIFIGGNVGGGLNSFDVGPSLIYENKLDHAYSLSYGILQKDLVFGIYWKIHL